MSTANVVVPPVIPEPVTAELPPLPPTQLPPQEPQIQQTQPPIQNTPPPAPVANPISQNQPPAPPADTSFDGLPKKHIISKKIAATVLVLFLAVTIPLTVFVANQQQNTKTGATNQDPLVGTLNLNGSLKQIHKSDILPIALEQYSSNSITNDALITARDTYDERKILDTKKAELNLSVSQADIDSLAANTGLTQKQAKYELLKQQIIISQVNWVKVVSIGYWTPPSDEGTNYSTDDQVIIGKQNQEGKNAITQVGNLLVNQDVLTVAQSIYINPAYTNLAPILAMNGSKFAQIDDTDKATAAEAVLYEYGDTNFDNATRDLVFGAAKGAVVTTSQPDQSNGGQVVFKIIDKGNGTFDSYKTWLNQQEQNFKPFSF